MPEHHHPSRPRPGGLANPSSAPVSANTETAAVTGASLMIGLSIGSRVITFVANQLLLRYLTASILGIAAQLEVYYITVLFFARESLRVSIQRQGSSSGGSKNHQAVVNLGYLAPFMGSFLSLGLGYLYSSSVSEATYQTLYFPISLRIYGVASLIELLSEPIFVLMQIRLQYSTRATAESTATFLRCATTFIMVVAAHHREQKLGVLPFALGQLVYGITLLLVYLWSGWHGTSEGAFSLLPKRIENAESASIPKRGGKGAYIWSYFYRPTVSLATSMMAQSVVKQILTQGDAFLISIWSTPHAQGIYSLANNYGGLLARLVLQPIEESSRAYFSRELAAASSKPHKKDDKAVAPSAESAKSSAQYIQMLLRVYVLLSAVIMAVGPAGAPALLAVVAGSSWNKEGAGEVLAVYCYYIPLLALNGITEALVSSVATEAQVHRQSAWMTFFSLVFAAAGYVCLVGLDLGASGLVYANCINMTCRIVWSLKFIKTYFDGLGVPWSISDLQPTALTSLIVLVTPRLVGRLTGVTARSAGGITNVVKVAATAIPFILAVIFAEREFILVAYRNLRNKQKTA